MGLLGSTLQYVVGVVHGGWSPVKMWLGWEDVYVAGGGYYRTM